MTKGATIWSGDWRDRLAARLRSAGSSTAMEFLAQRPGVPYTRAAEELGGDIAALQLEWVQFDEARRQNALRLVAMDSLARDLRSSLPTGWEGGAAGHFNTARAFGAWSARLGPELADRADAIWDALEASSPPRGWMPSGPDDPTLVDAFRHAWPE